MLDGMSLMNKLMRFAQTRQGRKLTNQAMNYARTPQGRRKIQQVRAQLMKSKRH